MAMGSSCCLRSGALSASVMLTRNKPSFWPLFRSRFDFSWPLGEVMNSCTRDASKRHHQGPQFRLVGHKEKQGSGGCTLPIS